MCGIFGCVNQQNLKGEDLIKVSRLLQHRGPDDEGFLTWEKDQVSNFSGPDSAVQSTLLNESADIKNALVHRRLSIQDLSQKGHQPMSLKERELHIVFNGEIYNFKELAGNHGLDLTSGTDTEVVLRMYEKLGLECFEYFRGMWAIAILDLKNKELVLSRDRFGIKPLYYRQDADSLAFSSEIKPLLHLQRDKSPEISSNSLLEYVVFGASNNPYETFFEGVNSLKPGTNLIFSLDNFQAKEVQYYNLEQAVKSERDYHSYSFDELFSESVREHLIADVEVGSCLSGGLDSSLIVSQSAHIYKGTFRTYTCSFPGSDIDESRFARILGEKYSRVHQHFTNPRATDFLRSIEDLIEIHERPIGSASFLLNMP
jgi:asparagine synthase (glutamine-hydrolysing)